MRRAKRYLPVIAICLLSGVQVAAAVASTMQVECFESCPNDDETGHCPPTCWCSCHAPSRPGTVQLKVARLELPSERFVAEELSIPASPEPKPLRHVPKSAA